VKNWEMIDKRGIDQGREKGRSGHGKAAGGSVVAGDYNAFVEFKFHVYAFRSMSHPSGYLSMCKFYLADGFQQSVLPVSDLRLNALPGCSPRRVQAELYVGLLIRKTDFRMQNIPVGFAARAF